jgi:8-oxo-dGTP pyrophosphatase MutT (NUDIX family)
VSHEPATPRPAATILLLRKGGRHDDSGVEVLMVRRSTEASFMPGVWVFPGGIIEPGESAAECAARELAEEAAIDLGTEAELVAWSRWITPEAVPVRFDTHFFVALAGPHAKPEADGVEVSDAGWFAPRAALESHAAGELELVFPTIKTLETLLEHETAAAVIEAARGREIEPILPRVVGTRAEHRVLLPWDDGYEDAAVDIGSLPP